LQLNEITLDHEKSPAWLSLRYLYSSSPVFFVFPGILEVEIVFYYFFFSWVTVFTRLSQKKVFYYYFYFNYRFERKKNRVTFLPLYMCVHYYVYISTSSDPFLINRYVCGKTEITKQITNDLSENAIVFFVFTSTRGRPYVCTFLFLNIVYASKIYYFTILVPISDNMVLCSYCWHLFNIRLG
jgi:hypothetical protein